MPAEITIAPATTAPDDSLQAIQSRVGQILCDMAASMVAGATLLEATTAACVAMEHDYESLMLENVDFGKFAFEAAATIAIEAASVGQLKDDKFRDALTSEILDMIESVEAPLSAHYKAKLMVTQLAETRIKARLEIGGGLTPEIEAEEYAIAAAFVSEQLKQMPKIKPPRRPFSIDLG